LKEPPISARFRGCGTCSQNFLLAAVGGAGAANSRGIWTGAHPEEGRTEDVRPLEVKFSEQGEVNAQGLGGAQMECTGNPGDGGGGVLAQPVGELDLPRRAPAARGGLLRRMAGGGEQLIQGDGPLGLAQRDPFLPTS
jgi:hypothetical protein